MAVGRGLLLNVAVRSLLLQASWSTERMQTLGFAYALMPALRALYPDRQAYRDRLAAHLEYFNTQPYLAAFILGAVVRLEEDLATGRNPAADTSGLKASLMGPLGALGDSVYWGGLKPFAAAVGGVIALFGLWWAPVLFLVVYNVWHVRQRMRLVLLGYDSAGDISALVAHYPLMRSARIFKLSALAVLGSLAATMPFWHPSLRPPFDLPAWTAACGSLGLILAFAAVMRAGLSPIRLVITCAAVCLALSLIGVIG